MDRLDEIVKLVGSNAVGKKEGHLVVQKYIGNVWLKMLYNVEVAKIEILHNLRYNACQKSWDTLPFCLLMVFDFNSPSPPPLQC